VIPSIAPSSQDRVRGRTCSKAGWPVADTIEKIELTGEIEHWHPGCDQYVEDIWEELALRPGGFARDRQADGTGAAER
jgi:hypothetical protein